MVDGQPLHAIVTVRRDGTKHRRLTPWRLDAGFPDWSPNGRWITFKSQIEGRRQTNVWLVHPNGTDLHRITHTFGGTYTWLPPRSPRTGSSSRWAGHRGTAAPGTLMST
jgi:hypothetical protein